MYWKAREIREDEVEKGITQRDQFSNDDVGIVETLGRETVQNSLDAAATGGPVRLRFTIIKENLDPDYFGSLFDGLEKHLTSSGIDTDSVDWKSPEVLVIEDFGTSGLTGATNRKDEGNFSDFWRRHGLSHKAGVNLGRWGLGKLVFSCISQIGCFFGLTVREDDKRELLMGQAVLNRHEIEGTPFDAHVMFAYQPDVIQLPIDDNLFISDFAKYFQLSRKGDEPGLSIVIPFPAPILTPDALLETLILNYFFPILTGDLEIEVCGEILNSETIKEKSKIYAGDKLTDTEELFSFIEQVLNFPKEDIVHAKQSWFLDGKVTEESFITKDIEKLRDCFSSRRTVGIKLPVIIAEKKQAKKYTFVHAFFKKPKDISAGRDIYVRGSITLPGESKFSFRKALGILLAEEETVVSFLGDAENPAHTKWNSNAEKLSGYVNPGSTLRSIRNSLVQIHDLLAQEEEIESDDPLRKFFSIPSPSKKNKQDKPVPPPPPPPPPTIKPVRVETGEDGFTVLPSPSLSEEEIPFSATVEVAYNRPDGIGAAFRRYSPYDFDLSKPPITITINGAEVIKSELNKLEIDITDTDFEVNVRGFDTKREPVVKVII